MKKLEDSAIQLAERISNVFRDVPSPGPNLLREDSFDDSEVVPFEELEHWSDTPGELVENGAYSLSFFSGSAFRYFTPAFMIWILENINDSTSITPNALLHSLPHWTDAFTKVERDVIHEFLGYLSKYWGHRLDCKALERCIRAYEPRPVPKVDRRNVEDECT